VLPFVDASRIETDTEQTQVIEMLRRALPRAKKLGVDIKHVFLTTGEFDILVIAEAKDGDAMAKMAMMAGAEGNVRTRTIRAWTEPEIAKLISELP